MIELLKKFSLFDGMAQNELEQIAGLCGVRKIGKGSTLFASGDPAQFVFLVCKGGVDLCCRVSYKQAATDICIDHISEGEAMGWSALTHPFKYHLNAHVVEDTELIEIERHAIERICQENKNIGYKLMNNIAKIIGRRVSAMQRTVRDLIQQGLKDKESIT